MIPALVTLAPRDRFAPDVLYRIIPSTFGSQSDIAGQ